MSRNRCAATRLTPAQAHEVWTQSDEASAFTRPDYLAQLVDEVEWWGVERSGEPVAAWPLVRAAADGEIAPPPFCYYVGPMFARSLRDDKYSRYWTAFTETFSELVDRVAAEYSAFSFSLPIGLTDVRVLEWWNFDHPGLAGFTTKPRYTARIAVSELPDEEALRLSFASDRRRHVNRWMRTPPDVVDTIDEERVIALHDESLQRNGSPIDPARHIALRRLISLARGGGGSVFGLSPPGCLESEAVVILLDGPTESNGVVCAASSDWRDEGLVAWGNWLSLRRARSLGKRWFDFNGANSPGRAQDKHLYGARVELYFNCSFGRTASRK